MPVTPIRGSPQLVPRPGSGRMSHSTQWPTPDRIGQLISEAQAGSTASVNALLSALRPGLVGFFARRVSYDAAEDLAQAALLRITRALPTIEPERGDRFILTIACNLVRTAYARSAREQRRWAPEQLADRAEPTAAVDRHAEYKELATAVHRLCYSKLPPALQEVVLGLLRDETPSEIAKFLQINPVTVRTRLMRARTILRRELRPFLYPDDMGSGDPSDDDPDTHCFGNGSSLGLPPQ